MASKVHVPDDRYFGPDPRQKEIAQRLYQTVANLPLICPHGHVDPRMFADPHYSLGTPTDLLIIPDHYVFRMLYSQGVPMESLGLARKDGGPVETDHRKIWQTFADHFYLFRGTPTGMWLIHELLSVFGVDEKLCGESAQRIYDQIAAKLASPEFRPRALFERFNIEVLSTTDVATDPLVHHQALRTSGWKGRIVPCFRPDGVVNIDAPNWRKNIDALSAVSGIEVTSAKTLVKALENRRAFFKSLGATATDHAAMTAHTEHLAAPEAEAIFQRAMNGQATAKDAMRFTGHMLMEMARMSIEDGLVMQLSRRLVPQPQPAALRALRDRHGRGYPDRQRIHAQPAPAAGQVRQRDAAHPDPVHPGRVHLLARTRPAGRPLPRAAAGPALVVLRQPERHGARPRLDDRDGGAVQHGRVQRRHPRLPLDSRAARPLAPRGRQLDRRAWWCGASWTWTTPQR